MIPIRSTFNDRSARLWRARETYSMAVFTTMALVGADLVQYTVGIAVSSLLDLALPWRKRS